MASRCFRCCSSRVGLIHSASRGLLALEHSIRPARHCSGGRFRQGGSGLRNGFGNTVCLLFPGIAWLVDGQPACHRPGPRQCGQPPPQAQWSVLVAASPTRRRAEPLPSALSPNQQRGLRLWAPMTDAPGLDSCSLFLHPRWGLSPTYRREDQGPTTSRSKPGAKHGHTKIRQRRCWSAALTRRL